MSTVFRQVLYQNSRVLNMSSFMVLPLNLSLPPDFPLQSGKNCLNAQEKKEPFECRIPAQSLKYLQQVV
jgi:hypothetical protein